MLLSDPLERARPNPSTGAQPVKPGDGYPARADGPADAQARLAGEPSPGRLDRGTQLVIRAGYGWRATVYEDAGEAVVWRPSRGGEAAPPGTGAEAAEGSPEGADAHPPTADLTAADDTDAADDNRERSSRRARGRVRRFAVANRLRWLVTLTYAPPQPTDPAEVLRDVQAFQRRLESRYPGLVWLRVFERHRSGALHVHVLTNGPHGGERRSRTLAQLWGHGFVDARRFRDEGGRAAARRAAIYAAKYVSKGAVSGLGRHSYEVREGHQPIARRIAEWSRDDAWASVVRAMGGEVPAYEWDSSTLPDWRGPPVLFMSWG